jgi:hypothetical protein
MLATSDAQLTPAPGNALVKSNSASKQVTTLFHAKTQAFDSAPLFRQTLALLRVETDAVSPWTPLIVPPPPPGLRTSPQGSPSSLLRWGTAGGMQATRRAHADLVRWPVLCLSLKAAPSGILLQRPQLSQAIWLDLIMVVTLNDIG